MIDETNLAIEELAEEIKRDNLRRYAFYRMLNATDKVLWRLEELNRDGVKGLPNETRLKMRASLDELPESCMEVYRESDVVQETLDSIFEVQERLFRWRDPARTAEDEEELVAAAV